MIRCCINSHYLFTLAECSGECNSFPCKVFWALGSPAFVVFSRLVTSYSLRPHGLSTPGLYSWPLLKFAQVHVSCIGDIIQQSYPMILSSPSALNLFQCSHQMTKILEFQLQHQTFQQVFRVRIYWFDLCCPRNFQESSPAPWFEGINSSVFRLLYGQLSQPYLAMALTIWTFVSRVMSLLFTTLFRFVIAFLPRSKCLLISWLQSPYTVILEPKKRKSVTTSTFSPSICHEVMGLDAMILVFFLIVLSF